MPRKKTNYCIFTEASIVNRVRAIVPVASSNVLFSDHRLSGRVQGL